MTKTDTNALTRAELINVMRQRLAVSGRDASAILESFVEALTEGLESGCQVRLGALGRFRTRTSPARPGRNPKTGEPAQVPAHRRVSFTMSRALRLAMSEKLAEKTGQPGQAGPAKKSPPVPAPPKDQLAAAGGPGEKKPAGPAAGTVRGGRPGGGDDLGLVPTGPGLEPAAPAAGRGHAAADDDADDFEAELDDDFDDGYDDDEERNGEAGGEIFYDDDDDE